MAPGPSVEYRVPSQPLAPAVLYNPQTLLLDVGHDKPAAALKRLAEWIDTEGPNEWHKQARVAAVLGSCPKSRASLHSGSWTSVIAPLPFITLRSVV